VTGRERKIAALFLVLGGALGFGGGVLSVSGARAVFAALFRSEQAADVKGSTKLDRPAFELSYPGNWKVDTSATDYDPDHMFSIDSSGNSFALFVVAETTALEPSAVVEEHAKLQTEKVVKGATRTPFTKWGAFEGSGVTLTGKMLGITPGVVRIFAWRSATRTFTVVESTYDDDRANVSPGFDLIARSFRVKE
jgi:hypothetical protein